MHTKRPERWRIAGWSVVAGLLIAAIIAPSSINAADPNGPAGNNGTVKIHDGAGEPASEVRNEPHVCTFHLHFFFADPEQAGTWEIQEWSPGDKGVVVLTGTYDTAGDGEDRQPPEGTYSLPNGHYKLFWDGDLDTDKHDKMKVFWVDCPEATATPTETAPPPTETAPPATGTVAPTETTPPATGTVAPTETTPPATGTVAPTETAAPTETTPPTGEVQPATGTPKPTGEVQAAVGTPRTTLPPTDTDGTSSSAGPVGWRVVLIGLAAMIAALLMLQPRRIRNRR